MSFYKYAIEIIKKELHNKGTIKKIIIDIKNASSDGLIAFYPCNKFFRDLFIEIKKISPEIIPNIFGCFDKSSNVNTEACIDTYNIKDLDKYADKISLLVITSNNFPSRELRDINALTKYRGKIIETSNFDISLKQHPDEVLLQIKEVYESLEDDKSKMTYLLVWLYTLLKDETLSNIFDREEIVNVTEDEINWKGYSLKGLGKNFSNIEELHYEIYKMKHVYPEEGDIVFDIGAYVGDTAAFFAFYVGNKGKVYSFEPIKANYDLLIENIKLNKLDNIVIPVNSGCSKTTKTMGGVSIEQGAPWSFLTENTDDEEVDVVSIDDFAQSNNINKIDLIKMDVEGHERDVILGAKKVINEYKPKMVICLYHKTEDLIELPLLMKKFGGYKFYIRCAKGGPFGTILFCEKKK